VSDATDIIALSGRYGNLALLASSIIASSEDPDAGPATNVYLNDPTKPWIASSPFSPQWLTFDLNHKDNSNGGLDVWDSGLPVGFLKTTSAHGHVVQETGPANVHTAGGSSVKITKDTTPDYAFLYSELMVPSYLRLKVRQWVLNGTPASGLYIQNLDTGNWLGALGTGAAGLAQTWSPTVVPFHAFAASGQNPGNYVQEITRTALVEDAFGPNAIAGMDATRNDLTTLRFMWGWNDNSLISSASTFYLDDIEILFEIDLAALIYHNLRVNDQLRVQLSMDGTTWVDASTFDLGRSATRKRNLWTSLNGTSPRGYRYARIRMDAPVGLHIGGSFGGGAPTLMPVLGQAQTLSCHEGFSIQTDYDWNQQRDPDEIYAFAQESEPRRKRGINIEPRGDVEFSQELVDVLFNLYYRSNGGVFPTLLIPSNQSSECFYGRFASGLSMSRDQFLLHSTKLSLREYPAPLKL
jgi:hypothetical protein